MGWLSLVIARFNTMLQHLCTTREWNRVLECEFYADAITKEWCKRQQTMLEQVVDFWLHLSPPFTASNCWRALTSVGSFNFRSTIYQPRGLASL
eukprot:4492942-Amphidinium_carterae.1